MNNPPHSANVNNRHLLCGQRCTSYLKKKEKLMESGSSDCLLPTLHQSHASSRYAWLCQSSSPQWPYRNGTLMAGKWFSEVLNFLTVLSPPHILVKQVQHQTLGSLISISEVQQDVQFWTHANNVHGRNVPASSLRGSSRSRECAAGGCPQHGTAGISFAAESYLMLPGYITAWSWRDYHG